MISVSQYIALLRKTEVYNGTSENVGLGKFWPDLEISEGFLMGLEVSNFFADGSWSLGFVVFFTVSSSGESNFQSSYAKISLKK